MISILRSKLLTRGMVMCPTPEAFTSYSEHIPLPYIYDQFDEPALERIMRFQKSARFRLHQIWRHEMAQLEVAAQELRARRWEERMVRLQERAMQKRWTDQQVQIAYERAIVEEEAEEKQNSDMRATHGRRRKNELRKPYMMFVILDDLSSDKKTMKSELLKKMINNGRHFMLMLCIAVQYVIDFPAGCRAGLDWVCVFWDSLAPNLVRLYENIVGVFPDLSSFKAALSEACRQNCCLMVKKNVPSADPWDCVFFYKATVTHLSTKYFGDETYEFVGNMFLDEEKFRAAEGAVRDSTEDKPARGSTGGRRKAASKKDDSAGDVPDPPARKTSKRAAAATGAGSGEADAVAAWDDEDEDRVAAEREKQERDDKIKQNVASLRRKLAHATPSH